jgi:hypothetical protein
MDYLQEMNRKPIENELFLYGLSRGNFSIVEAPHSHTSFFLVSLKKETKMMPKLRTDRRGGLRTATQEGIAFPARKK